MIRKKVVNTIGDAYVIFNRQKIAGGMGTSDSMNYWDCIKPFLDFAGLDESTEVKDIDTELVTDWTIEMMKTLRPTSVNHYLRGLRVFLYWLIKEYGLEDYKVKLVKAQETELKFIPDDEIKVLLRKPSKDASFSECRTHAIVCFLLATGCRASTLVNIKIEDVNLKDRIIVYRHSKNKSLNSVPVSPMLNKVLTEFLNEWQRDNNEGYLFCSRYEGQMTTNALKHSLAKYCINRGLKPHYPHSFRHTFARQWVVNGGNAFSLQHMLNHSDLTMTKKYVRVFSNDLKEDIESFAALDVLYHDKKQTVRRSN